MFFGDKHRRRSLREVLKLPSSSSDTKKTFCQFLCSHADNNANADWFVVLPFTYPWEGSLDNDESNKIYFGKSFICARFFTLSGRIFRIKKIRSKIARTFVMVTEQLLGSVGNPKCDHSISKGSIKSQYRQVWALTKPDIMESWRLMLDQKKF